MNILQPNYLKKFKCIGPDCEDTCCRGWNVTIDRNTFMKYKQINSSLDFDNKIRKNKKSTLGAYGSIILDKEGYCKFLDDRGLCKIQLEVGEEYLSHTCKYYPRNLSKIDNNLECFMTLSCPEVARLVVLEEDSLVLDNVDIDGDIGKPMLQFNPNKEQYKYNISNYFWDIRVVSLMILQNRSIDISDRMIVLGFFYEKLNKSDNRKKTEEIIIEYENIVSEISTFDFVKVEDKEDIKKDILRFILDIKSRSGIKNERFVQCLQEVVDGLDLNGDNFIENYNAGRKALNYFLKRKDFVLENILVNEFMRTGMPLGSYENIWDSYVFLAVLYSTLNFYLVGLSRYNGRMTDEIVIKLVQSFSRENLHNPEYINSIVNFMKSNDLDNLPYLSILIKS